MKVWKVALVSVLALGLVLGMVSPALAAPPWASSPTAAPPLPRVIRGEVVSIEGNTAFVVRSGWNEVRVLVDSEAEYFKASVPAGALTLAPLLVKPDGPSLEGFGLRHRLHRLVAGRLMSPFGEEVTFGYIEVGSFVVVWALADGGNLLAKRVVIIEPTTYHHLVGTILGVDTVGKAITITSDDCGSIFLNYDEETCFILRGSISLEVDDSVHAVYDEGGIAKVVVVINRSY